MRIIKTTCGYCGAPLEVSARSRHATCRYCGSSLTIDRASTPNQARLAIPMNGQGFRIEDLDENDPAIKALLAKLRVLDANWLNRRDDLLKSQQQATVKMVSPGNMIGFFSVAMIAIVGCALATWVVGMTGFVFFALAGIVPIALMVFKGSLGFGQTRSFIAQSQGYVQQRMDLVRQLREHTMK